MNLKMFCVYDSKALAYMSPFFMSSIGQATRAFGDTCNDKGSGFNKHPEDYTLFYVGDWNDTNASFQPLKTPTSLGLAIEYKKEVAELSATPIEAAIAASKSNSSLSAEQ